MAAVKYEANAGKAVAVVKRRETPMCCVGLQFVGVALGTVAAAVGKTTKVGHKVQEPDLCGPDIVYPLVPNSVDVGRWEGW